MAARFAELGQPEGIEGCLELAINESDFENELELPDSRYSSIVPFIWDDACRTEGQKGLISALKQMNGITEAVVVAKPSTMK